MDRDSRIRAYYRRLDNGEYAELESLLHPEFVQQRPDRTFEDRAAFIQFMRSERPLTETTHELTAVCASEGGRAASGRLLDADGNELFAFIDVFEFGPDGQLTQLTTYV
ncbi:nuclear transport factor 2 family protein [Halonotius pteroides]|uniref:Nuclear transport factor 2 family protein n=1 Tax=Halonotius pteroides TaxID=268735 RepID=A0A3A6Q5F1_9EURY|nr:nuclear transport factor 2 family protein [Halonotius pteroides]RJX48611.1 nuclear transport factor 2 family protein [Halonotius pteroides]